MEFIKRITAPSDTDKYWIKSTKGGLNRCIEISNGSCLPNCVGYAWGRFYEITGKEPKLSRANAENWFGNNDGYSRGLTPKLGAVICWRKGQAGNSSDGAGHIAIVEEIKPDGSIVTSNSAYKGKRFYTKTLQPPYDMGGSYTFQGFIYPPISFETIPVKKYIQLKSGVWCRKGIGFRYAKYKVIPKGTKCELLTKNAGKSNLYNWDKIIYNKEIVYLPNKWNIYL